jgi:hypothetical protein
MSQIIQSTRIPTREAGGTYANTGRFDGDIGARMGRHSSKAKDRSVRSLRKKQRRELDRISTMGYED